MKEFRPLILWFLILGIAFTVWNNFSSKQQEKPQQPILPQASLPRPASPSHQPKIQGIEHQNIRTSEHQSPQPQRGSRRLKEFGILAGFAKGELKEKDDYELIPVILRFGFNLNRFLNIPSKKQLFEFQVEPFASAVINPDANAEIGVNLLFKFGYFLTKKFMPFVEAGAGMIYITQHTREQSTQFNFIPQAGAGISYFLRDNFSVNAGYRYRHLSNSSIKEPNKGINIDMLLVGLSWYF